MKNGQNNHCMQRMDSRKKILVIAAMILIQSTAVAQTYSAVKRHNFWNDGFGVTGIRQDTVSIAVAEAYGNYVSGGLRASSEASSLWRAGAYTSAIRHLKNFSMTGSFSFDQMWGEGMCGSMFVRPGFYPVDVYEFTPGSKSRQTYEVCGGISVDVSPLWRLGGEVDFTSANYAKRKDLRHTTYMLDFSVKPGVQYHNGDLALALNYIFSKNSETVKAEQVGTSVASYDAFFDKGLYYGVKNIWTGSGVHLNEPGIDGLPVSETINGLSLQFSYGGLYAGVQGRLRNGQVGEKLKVWYRFSGYDVSAHLGYRFESIGGTHYFRGSFEYLDQSNDEYALESKTEGGVTNTYTIGSNRLFSRGISVAGLGYEFSGSGWNIMADASLTAKNGLLTIIYPCRAEQKLIMPSIDLSAKKAAGPFDIRLAAGWSNGSLAESNSILDESSGLVSSPERLESYFLKYSEHMTHNKIVLSPSLRFNFAKGLYVEGAFWWNHGFGMQYLGADRFSTTLRFGYNF